MWAGQLARLDVAVEDPEIGENGDAQVDIEGERLDAMNGNRRRCAAAREVTTTHAENTEPEQQKPTHVLSL